MQRSGTADDIHNTFINSLSNERLSEVEQHAMLCRQSSKTQEQHQSGRRLISIQVLKQNEAVKRTHCNLKRTVTAQANRTKAAEHD